MIKKSLKQLYEEHQGKVSDKWSIYLSEYDRIFAPYRDGATRLLEIGIQNGGSLDIWVKYFPNAQKLVGCDINPDCAKLTYDDPRISVIVGDANTNTTQTTVLSISPQFDVIVDDGSHRSSDIVKSFAKYWPHLADGGVYVVEDLHCSYWRDYEGGLYDPYSSMSFFKRLADVINYEHWGLTIQRSKVFAGMFAHYDFFLDEELFKHIHSLEFINSVCVIRKKIPIENILGSRIFAGSVEKVIPGHIKLCLSLDHTADENNNIWSNLLMPPDEGYIRLQNELTEKNKQLSAQNYQILEGDRQLALINGHLADKDQHIARKDGQLALINGHLADKDQNIARKDEQLAEINVQFALLNQKITALYNSSSWSITAPLRFILRQLKRIPLVITLALPAIKLGGGVFNTGKKAIKLYRREGIPGIKRGFRLAATTVEFLLPIDDDTTTNLVVDCNDYTEWVRQYDTLTEADRSTMRVHQAEFGQKPLISVLMPINNPRLEWLISAIESVKRQIYQHWELCLTNNAVVDSAVRSMLEHCAADDSRIKVIFLPQNADDAALAKSALDLATGAWLIKLEPNDLLSEHSLFWMVQTINKNKNTSLIYADEDKIDVLGQRYDPYFKCDWNIDLFYSQNLLGRVILFQADLLRQIGGYREEFGDSNIYEMALRYIEHIRSDQIEHIPRVLHHESRQIDSTHISSQALSKQTVATQPDVMGVHALNEHFQRLQIKANAEITEHGYRIRYPLPEELPLVTLIIPTRNGLSLLRQCIDSIVLKTTYSNYEILIVDNGSDEPGTLVYLRALAQNTRYTILKYDGPFNYSALNNKAVKIAKGNIIALINNDIEVISAEWLSEMVSHALRPNVGAVGARLWFADNTLQHAGVILGCHGLAGHAHKNLSKNDTGYFNRADMVQNYSAVTAACLVIQKCIFLEMGGLNETDLCVAFNDVDLCAKLIRAGYRNIWTPYADLYHHESATRGSDDANQVVRARTAKEASYMQRHWSSLLAKDPAYSPNLTLMYDDFSLAWPPRLEKLSMPKSTEIALRKHYLFLTYRMILGWGVDVAVANMAQHMIAMGYKVTIGCLDQDDSYNHLNVMLVQNDPQSIDRLIEQLGCDCVVAHTSPFFEVLPHLKSKISMWAMEYGDPTPELFTHDFMERNVIKQNKLRNCYPFVNGVIGISKFIRSDIQWPTAKIVYMGCDHAPDLGPKGVFDIDQIADVSLKVGTLMRLGQGESNYKGNKLFLDLVAKYKSKNSAVKFFVMGRGTPEDAHFFESMGVEVFLNAPDDEKWTYLRGLDVFLSPSQWEGFNLPLAEAQALGTIGLAFDTGAHPEVTPHVVSSVDEAAKLIQVLSQNKALLLQESTLAYRYVRNQFSWKKSAVDLLQITSGH